MRLLKFLIFLPLFFSDLLAVQPFTLFFNATNNQNLAGIFAEKYTYDNLKSGSPGLFTNLNKNFSEKWNAGFFTSFSNYETRTKKLEINELHETKSKKLNFCVLPYFSFSGLRIGAGFEKGRYEKNILFAEFRLFDDKKFFIAYTRILEIEKEFFFGIKGGDPFFITFQAGKIFPYNQPPEFSFSILFGFRFGDLETGLAQNFRENREGSKSLAFLSYDFSDRDRTSFFGKEKNPIFEEEIQFEKKKKPKKNRKEKIIHPVTLDELLKEKIPLAIALKISAASKSKESYENALKKVPQPIVKKLNYLQFKKSQAEADID